MNGFEEQKKSNVPGNSVISKIEEMRMGLKGVKFTISKKRFDKNRTNAVYLDPLFLAHGDLM